MNIRIATRTSKLALWQAEFVQKQLEQIHPDARVSLVALKTRGDKLLDTPLAKIGGKALFVKELEAAMLEGQADIAVHSMKDVPMELPQGFALPVICERAAPTDAWVSNAYATLNDVPEGGRIGTSSLRRSVQIKAKRPDLDILSLRGNVQTRLAKLDQGDFDGIVLATAGLERMQLDDRIRQKLPPEQSLPAVGQGAIGIECLADAETLIERLLPLNHKDTWDRVMAERAMNHRLEGGCQVPIGGYAELQPDDQLWLRGLVASEDGRQVLTAEGRRPRQEAETLGIEIAEALLEQGAGAILDKVYGR